MSGNGMMCYNIASACAHSYTQKYHDIYVYKHTGSYIRGPKRRMQSLCGKDGSRGARGMHTRGMCAQNYGHMYIYRHIRNVVRQW
jgi:hypothetical protein